MPRSFLVKKPPGTRVPNYGRLETRLGRCRGREPGDPSWGLTGPLFLQDGSGCPAACPCHAGSPWDRHSVIACLSPPLPPQSELREDPDLSLQGGATTSVDSTGSSLAWSTPIRDNQNLLPLPAALRLHPRRTPSPGNPAEGEGSHVLGEPGMATATATAPLERLGSSDCQKPCGTFLGLVRLRQPRSKPTMAAAARKYFTCKHCDKEYVSLGALKMHIRTHTLPCVCKICGKAFSRPWLLQGHIRTHTGEKPYACSHCSRAFADRSNLRAHLQTHSDIKKYQCHACLKTFSRMSLLLRHEEASGCPTAT